MDEAAQDIEALQERLNLTALPSDDVMNPQYDNLFATRDETKARARGWKLDDRDTSPSSLFRPSSRSGAVAGPSGSTTTTRGPGPRTSNVPARKPSSSALTTGGGENVELNESRNAAAFLRDATSVGRKADGTIVSRGSRTIQRTRRGSVIDRAEEEFTAQLASAKPGTRAAKLTGRRAEMTQLGVKNIGRVPLAPVAEGGVGPKPLQRPLNPLIKPSTEWSAGLEVGDGAALHPGDRERERGVSLASIGSAEGGEDASAEGGGGGGTGSGTGSGRLSVRALRRRQSSFLDPTGEREMAAREQRRAEEAARRAEEQKKPKRRGGYGLWRLVREAFRNRHPLFTQHIIKDDYLAVMHQNVANFLSEKELPPSCILYVQDNDAGRYFRQSAQAVWNGVPPQLPPEFRDTSIRVLRAPDLMDLEHQHHPGQGQFGDAGSRLRNTDPSVHRGLLCREDRTNVSGRVVRPARIMFDQTPSRHLSVGPGAVGAGLRGEEMRWEVDAEADEGGDGEGVVEGGKNGKGAGAGVTRMVREMEADAERVRKMRVPRWLPRRARFLLHEGGLLARAMRKSEANPTFIRLLPIVVPAADDVLNALSEEIDYYNRIYASNSRRGRRPEAEAAAAGGGLDADIPPDGSASLAEVNLMQACTR